MQKFLGTSILCAFMCVSGFASAGAQIIPYKDQTTKTVPQSAGNFQKTQQALNKAWDRTMSSGFDFNSDGDFNQGDVETLETGIGTDAGKPDMDLDGDNDIDVKDSGLARDLVKFSSLPPGGKVQTLQDLKSPAAALVIQGLCRSGQSYEAAALLQKMDSQTVADIVQDQSLSDQQIAGLLDLFSSQKAGEVLGHLSSDKAAGIVSHMSVAAAGAALAHLSGEKATGVLSLILGAAGTDSAKLKFGAALLGAVQSVQAVGILQTIDTGTAGVLLGHADAGKAAAVLAAMEADTAAQILSAMTDKKQAASILAAMDADTFNRVSVAMGSSALAKILEYTDSATFDGILTRLSERLARQIRAEIKFSNEQS